MKCTISLLRKTEIKKNLNRFNPLHIGYAEDDRAQIMVS